MTNLNDLIESTKKKEKIKHKMGNMSRVWTKDAFKNQTIIIEG